MKSPDKFVLLFGSILILLAGHFLDLVFAQQLSCPTPIFHNIARFLENYGEYPGYFLALTSFFYLLGHSKKIYASKKCHYLSKVIILSFFTGTILCVGITKSIFCRPRPYNVTELGGQEAFQPFFTAKLKRNIIVHRSFPSGHTSVASLFFALYFCAKKMEARWLTPAALTLSISYTTLVAWSRIAIKAHFLTDTLFSIILMIFVTHYFSKKYAPILETKYE